VTRWTNPLGDEEDYGYDDANRRTAVTNGRNYTRTYAYTNRGEVYTLTMPDSTVEAWSHDGNGAVTAYENQLDQTIGYAYDEAGRQTGIDYISGTDPSFGYDAADRLTSMVDSTGTTSWTYNAAGEVTDLNTPQGNMDYTYYADGSRHTMVEGVGTTTYSYDEDGRLTGLENPYGEDTVWEYDAADRCTKQTFDTGLYTSFGYDERDRLTSLVHKNSSNVTISSESYTYDDASNLATKTVDSVTTTYGYDAADQLTSESRSGYSASYTYDANGNRSTKSLNSVTETYSYSNCDELTQITVGGNATKSFGYDDCGRTISVTVGGNTTTLSYDFENRLTTITYPSTATNTFTYNALGSRVGKVDSVGSFAFKRDGVDVTDPVLNDGAAQFTPGISERRSSITKFYHQNDLGTISGITNTSQSTTDTKQYDAFGLLVSSTGSTPTPFGYAGAWGYQEDGDSGLKLLGHRYYDPSTGRFLTRDPIKDGRNWYGYCDSNPAFRIDPSGLTTLVFNGTKLKWYDDGGKLQRIVPAFSGLPGTGKHSQISYGGPIPSGTYSIDPSKDQYATRNILSWPFAGFPPDDGWGDRRIPIEGGPNVNGRNAGYFLHGGKNVGSGGCIDIGPNDIHIIDRIGRLQKRVSLVVDYSQWNGTVPANENGGNITWRQYLGLN